MKVAVLGGGLIGLFASYYLLRSGCAVTIFDRETKNLASIYNSGLIVPSEGATPPISGWCLIKALSGISHPITFSVKQVLGNISFFYDALNVGISSADSLTVDLSKKSLALHQDFLKTESIDSDLVTGVLYVFNHYADAQIHSQKSGGTIVDSEQLEEWGYSGFGGAVLHEDEIGLNPRKLVLALRSRLQDMGATSQAVSDISLANEGNGLASVKVDGEKVQADAYVIAAGSWSKQLCHSLGYNIPLLPARGFVMIFQTKGSAVVQKPAILQDYGASFVPNGSNILRVTSFYEMVGFISEFSQGRKDWLLHIAEKHLTNHQDLNLVETGCGFRPCTSDQIPILGQIPGFSNTYIATGHARLGLTLSPLTGYVLDSMINKKKTNIDVSRMSPSRFMH